jgi:hypothetical protein
MHFNSGGSAVYYAGAGNYLGILCVSAGVETNFSLDAFNNDGVTLSTTKGGSPTGTAYGQVFFMR